MSARPPARPFRIIRGQAANYRVHTYKTQEARDKAADKWAARDLETVLCELWDADHPQDELNQGWGLDRVSYPRGSCHNCGSGVQIVNRHVENGRHADVWVHINDQATACTRYDGVRTVAAPRHGTGS